MLSRRVSLQWLPDPVSEPTSTYVITSPGEHFVDIRILESNYPYTSGTKELKDVFDWVSSGKEEPVSGTNEIKFRLEIDSNEILDAIKTGKPIEECRRATDSGFFSAIEGSEDRKEVGNMVDPSVGEKRDYIEIWRSLDSEKHTPTNEVRETTKLSPEAISYVLVIAKSSVYEGKVVRVGNWVQGLIHNTETHEVHVIRSWFNGADWEFLIKFGDVDLFDVSFKGSKGDSTDKSGVVWKCIE